MNICNEHASCTNTQGPYSCACNPEYIGVGFTCKGQSLLIDALFFKMALAELAVNNANHVSFQCLFLVFLETSLDQPLGKKKDRFHFFIDLMCMVFFLKERKLTPLFILDDLWSAVDECRAV